MINIANKDWHGVCYQINHCVNNNESLEINMTAVRDVLWLDPVEKIDASARAQMRVAGLNVVVVNTLEELTTMLGRVDLVVVRLVDDTSLLAEVRGLAGESMVDLPVVCRVGRGNLELAVAAMRDGAKHVVAADDWSAAVWEKLASQTAPSKPEPQTYVFADPASQKLLILAQRVAQAEVTTLLTGPTGAGKEVIARILHEASPRRAGPFVGLNCAAMPESMIEDMLFGHEKGAFTGALKDYSGVFEQAKGGTLFLDEIGEMPIRLQAKLLRVLQERQITRLGAQAPLNVDVRLVAATNCDLKAAIESRDFREDLYFRISTFRLRLPCLAERPLDIMPLAHLMLDTHGAGRRPWQIAPDAEALLLAHAWPGNVRELSNVMQRALVLSNTSLITATHLIFDEFSVSEGRAAEAVKVAVAATSAPAVNAAAPFAGGRADLDSAVRVSEHRAIVSALRASPSRNEAARVLGISPRTLRYKLAQLKGHGFTLAMAEAG